MHDQDKEIAEVLKAAGAREKPPAAVEQAVREGLRSDWLVLVAEGCRLRRRRAGFAIAAGLAIAAIGGWLVAPQFSGGGDAFGSVTLASGDVQVRTGFFGDWTPATIDQSLTTGQALETGVDSHVALGLPGGVSLRLDGGTRAILASPTEIILERGALYVDAGPASPAAARLVVATPAGLVRHVGTQYEVRLLGSGVRLRVREGRIEWRSKAGAVEQGRGGEQLTIAGDGSVERQETALYGESWGWIEAATPGIELEGLRLSEFLAWAARELGREVQFDRPETAHEAESIILHGSIRGLTPEQALEAVLATTRVRASISAGLIAVTGSGSSAVPAD